MNIAETWYQAQDDADTPGEAVAILNHDLGTNYTTARFNEWRHDARPMPDWIRDYMLFDAVPHACRQHIGPLRHMTDEQWEGLVWALGSPSIG